MAVLYIFYVTFDVFFFLFQYKQPQILLDMERAVRAVLKDIETERDLDAECDSLMKLMGKAAGDARET